MELFLLVIYPVQQVFQIGFLGLLSSEIAQQSLIKKLEAERTTYLLINRLDLTKQTIFLHLIQLKEISEQIEIPQSQKLRKGQFRSFSYLPIFGVIFVERVIQQNFIVEMLGQ